jgi:hypothetical protein
MDYTVMKCIRDPEESLLILVSDCWNNKPSGVTDLTEQIISDIWPYIFRPLGAKPQRNDDKRKLALHL